MRNKYDEHGNVIEVAVKRSDLTILNLLKGSFYDEAYYNTFDGIVFRGWIGPIEVCYVVKTDLLTFKINDRERFIEAASSACRVYSRESVKVELDNVLYDGKWS